MTVVIKKCQYSNVSKIMKFEFFSRFLYSLSVQRGPDEGPTSVRIHFSQGKFRLDAEDKIQHLMPAFKSVVDLVEYYR